MTGRILLLACALLSAPACRGGVKAGRGPAQDAVPAARPTSPSERRRVEYFQISDG